MKKKTVKKKPTFKQLDKEAARLQNALWKIRDQMASYQEEDELPNLKKKLEKKLFKCKLFRCTPPDGDINSHIYYFVDEVIGLYEIRVYKYEMLNKDEVLIEISIESEDWFADKEISREEFDKAIGPIKEKIYKSCFFPF